MCWEFVFPLKLKPVFGNNLLRLWCCLGGVGFVLLHVMMLLVLVRGLVLRLVLGLLVVVVLVVVLVLALVLGLLVVVVLVVVLVLRLCVCLVSLLLL